MCANPPGIEWEAVNHYSWFFPQGSEQGRMESQYIRLHRLRYNSNPFGSSYFQEDYTPVFTKQQ